MVYFVVGGDKGIRTLEPSLRRLIAFQAIRISLSRMSPFSQFGVMGKLSMLAGERVMAKTWPFVEGWSPNSVSCLPCQEVSAWQH